MSTGLRDNVQDVNPENLPIITHEYVADVECCGCLMVCVQGSLADILCNKCGTVIPMVAVGEVESIMEQMLQMVRSNSRWRAMLSC